MGRLPRNRGGIALGGACHLRPAFLPSVDPGEGCRRARHLPAYRQAALAACSAHARPCLTGGVAQGLGMEDDARLEDLLLRWEELAQAGQPVSASELCRECPQLTEELERRIQALQRMQWVSEVSRPHKLASS